MNELIENNKQSNKQELVPIQEVQINDKHVQAVSARDLHKFLGVTERFSSWMERQFQYGFEENVDYLGCKVFNTLAKQEVQEYYLSLDCAKEISMIQKSDKGKQARKYFIECENQLKQIISLKDSLLLGILKAEGDVDKALAINAYETQYVKPLEVKVEKQAVYIEKAKPKIAFHDAVTQSSSTVDMGVAAKLLNFKGIGRNKLFGLLRDFKILDKYNRPYQQYVDKGWFKLVETSFVHPTTGDNLINYKVVLFQKGLDNIHSILIKKGYECLGMISMEDDE